VRHVAFRVGALEHAFRERLPRERDELEDAAGALRRPVMRPARSRSSIEASGASPLGVYPRPVRARTRRRRTERRPPPDEALHLRRIVDGNRAQHLLREGTRVLRRQRTEADREDVLGHRRRLVVQQDPERRRRPLVLAPNEKKKPTRPRSAAPEGRAAAARRRDRPTGGRRSRDDGLPCSEAREELRQREDGPATHLDRLARVGRAGAPLADRRNAREHGKELRETIEIGRQDVVQRERPGEERRGELLDDAVHRFERHRLFRVAAAAQHQDVADVVAGRERLRHERGLSDPRAALHQRRHRGAVPQALDHRRELLDLDATADEPDVARREGASRERTAALARRQERLADLGHVRPTCGGRVEQSLGEPREIVRDVRRVRLRRRRRLMAS
jgi:hypothetical protein